MKKLFYKLVVVSMSFSIFCSPLFAAPKEATPRSVQKHSIGVGLGQTFLLGEMEDQGEDKITVDLLYTYTASYSFDLLLNFHASEHSQDEKEVELLGLAMSIKGRYYEFDAFSPYILGGLGFYLPRVRYSEDKISESKTTFGFNLGTGIDLRLNEKFVVGILGQLHKPFDVDQSDSTIKDVQGSYFKLLMTFMYLF